MQIHLAHSLDLAYQLISPERALLPRSIYGMYSSSY